MVLELGRQAYNALKHNRRRSILTMLGMAWGIATVVLLLAYGTGFERGLWVAFRSWGTNLIFIFPGRTSLQAGGTKAGAEVKLTINDLDYLQAEVPRQLSERAAAATASAECIPTIRVCAAWTSNSAPSLPNGTRTITAV